MTNTYIHDIYIAAAGPPWPGAEPEKIRNADIHK